MISEYLDKNNLHHAYLVEGAREEIVPEIFAFCESLGVKTSGNPDFCRVEMDNFKIDDALNLRAMSSEKGIAEKKIFVLSFNQISLDAQGVLLKMFEEPALNTHFFVIVPDKDAILKTTLSRFYLISDRRNMEENRKDAEKFIFMSAWDRVQFLKDLLAVPEEDDENTEEFPPYGGNSSVINSPRAKALKFLNALEVALHNKMSKTVFDINSFDQIFKVREFLRQPGSSAKTLMESVALVVPNF